MRQYELAIRIAQVHHLVDERKYKKALAVIQTLDMRQVRSLSDLKAFAEVYTRTEQYEAAKATYLRIYRRSKTRRVLYRLIYLSIRTNALEDAEAYYQEFIRMNPNARDALVLRYRIDKAAGVPIGQLIEILQELKQEEYIEEWAYELAKLYHRAGRREECLEECQDILLWFGSGEIVERAKILIDHLKEKDPIPYYDDKDFTVPKKEEPNPDDTGSLPDLNEFIKERKAQKREERRAEKAARKAEYEYEEDSDYGEDIFDDDIEEEELSEIKKQDKKKEIPEGFPKKNEEKQKAAKSSKEKAAEDDFIDDYEEDDFEQEGIDLPQKAMDGIQKLSGFLKFGKKDEESNSEKEESEPKKEPVQNRKESVKKESVQGKKEGAKKESEKTVEAPKKKALEYIPHSQSGTGITQDLAREISAIYEMEHREQLKEKAVTVINEVPNIATNVVDRMTQAIQKSASKSYIPLDIEEIQGKVDRTAEAEPAKDALTQALEKEVEEYQAAKAREEVLQGEEETKTEAIEETEPEGEAKTEGTEETEPEEEAKAESIEETEPEREAKAEGAVESELEEKVKSEDIVKAESEKELQAENITAVETEYEQESVTALESEDEEQAEDVVIAQPKGKVWAEGAVTDESLMGVETDELVAENETGESTLVEERQNETELLKNLLEEEIQDPEEPEEWQQKEEPVSGEETEERASEENLPLGEETGELPLEKKISSEEDTKDLSEERQQIETMASALENYQAPEIPVVETEYMEMPEITYEDLPTTRALQQSFKNVLKLIEGELDPSHFVLMGDGTERIVGVSKQIVRVMKETGYLSQGRIAKIHASQLNKMDLISFREQLKGNCLLIEEASDLLFPTITKIFSIMEEYYGDFVVILADEGTTLDQLFRFVPVLARKFKYIIDISKYTQKDYE